MITKKVIIYVSKNCPTSEKLMAHLNQYQILFETKNVTENYQYLRELQEMGIFGTPITHFVDQNQIILGFQKNKLNDVLGIRTRYYF